jgi:hypothetical protein
MSDNPLAKLDKARAYLAECRNLPDIKKIRDVAVAAREYARAQRLSVEVRNRAWEIQTEAERRAAEFLDRLERKEREGAGRPSKNCVRQAHPINSDYQEGLEQIGITRFDAARWRKVEKVPQKSFANYVDEVMNTGKEATTRGLLAFAHNDNGSKPKKRKKPVTGKSSDILRGKTDMEGAIGAFGSVDALCMRLRALVIEVMKLTPPEQWPELLAAAHEEIDDLAKRKP